MSWLGLLSLLGVFALWASVAAALILIEDRQAAVAYIDRIFEENGCRMSQAAFFRRMEVDGVAPTSTDMSQPLIGTEKIIRQRRIYAALEELFGLDSLSADADDKSIAISRFGGCA